MYPLPAELPDIAKNQVSKKVLLILNEKFYSGKHSTMHKKWSFPLRISSVNVTKSAVSCGFGHIYWRNP